MPLVIALPSDDSGRLLLPHETGVTPASEPGVGFWPCREGLCCPPFSAGTHALFVAHSFVAFCSASTPVPLPGIPDSLVRGRPSFTVRRVRALVGDTRQRVPSPDDLSVRRASSPFRSPGKCSERLDIVLFRLRAPSPLPFGYALDSSAPMSSTLLCPRLLQQASISKLHLLESLASRKVSPGTGREPHHLGLFARLASRRRSPPPFVLLTLFGQLRSVPAS